MNSMLESALVEAAWISARIAVALGLVVWTLGVLLARGGLPKRVLGAPAFARPGALPRAAAQFAALLAGGALCALTRGEAQRVLPPWGQCLVAGLASVLAPLGGMLGAWTARALGEAFVFAALVFPGAPLVTSGPFGIVRHPLYLSVGLWAVATGLALGSLSGTTVLLVLYLAASAWRARLEDAVLAEAFPDAFPDYAARVPAFLPKI
jgi:protein-S-isoprenylcysteine O-methyltransferase Ste14